MPAGRPLKYTSIEALQSDIDAYFSECKENKRPYTITGLALAIDTCRQTLCNYDVKPKFMDTIKRAKLRCEAFAEEQLMSGSNAAGPIFALKNYGWSDKHEVEHSGHIATKDQRDAAVKAALSAKNGAEKV